MASYLESLQDIASGFTGWGKRGAPNAPPISGSTRSRAGRSAKRFPQKARGLPQALARPKAPKITGSTRSRAARSAKRFPQKARALPVELGGPNPMPPMAPDITRSTRARAVRSAKRFNVVSRGKTRALGTPQTGHLKKFGYSTKRAAGSRRKALVMAMSAGYSNKSIRKQMETVAKYYKFTNPVSARVITQDIKWLQKHFRKGSHGKKSLARIVFRRKSKKKSVKRRRRRKSSKKSKKKSKKRSRKRSTKRKTSKKKSKKRSRKRSKGRKGSKKRSKGRKRSSKKRR